MQGVLTNDTYGDANLLPTAIDSIRERFPSRINPNVVAVVTGFIGESQIIICLCCFLALLIASESYNSTLMVGGIYKYVAMIVERNPDVQRLWYAQQLRSSCLLHFSKVDF